MHSTMNVKLCYNLVYCVIKSYSMQYCGMGRLFGAGNLNKVFFVTIFKFSVTYYKTMNLEVI
jgi:hypothetical protein